MNMLSRLGIIGIICGLSLGSLTAQEREEDKGLSPAARFSNMSEEDRTTYGKFFVDAQSFYRQKRIFECMQAIAEASAIFKHDARLWNLEGSCYVQIRNFTKAKASFQKAVELSPKQPSLLFNMAEMDFVSKDWSAALEAFDGFLKFITDNYSDEQIKVNPNVNELYRLGVFKKVLVLLELERLGEAKPLAQSLWDTWDDTPFTYYSKAAFHYKNDREDEGKEEVLKAFRVFGGLAGVSTWHDTMIEIGYVESFYGNEEDEEDE